MKQKWSKPILLQRQYARGQGKNCISIRLGFPAPSDRGDSWRCPFQVSGLRDSRIKFAHGVDGLQALVIAAAAIRRQLDRAKDIKVGTEPYEFVFPRFVPMSYGLEFHRRLCKLLSTEIEKKEKQLSKSRLGYRKKR